MLAIIPYTHPDTCQLLPSLRITRYIEEDEFGEGWGISLSILWWGLELRTCEEGML